MTIEELERLANSGKDGLITFTGDTTAKGYAQGKLMATMHNLSTHLIRFVEAYDRMKRQTDKVDAAVNEVVLNLNWVNLKEAIKQEEMQ